MRYLSRRLAIIAALWLCHGTAACVFTQDPTAAPVTKTQDMSGDMTPSDLGGDMTPADLGGDMVVADLGGDMAPSDMSGDMVVADMGGDMTQQDMGCRSDCEVGERRCSLSGRNILSCERDNLTGCNTFEVEMPCAAETVCEMRDGAPACGQPGPCVGVPIMQRCARVGATRCKDDGGLEVCQGDESDEQSCLQWTDGQCVEGQSCDAATGACVCENTCVEGQQRCGASGPERCEADGNGCLSWTASMACSASQSCQETNNGPTCCEDACSPSESGKGRCTSTSPGRYEVCRLQANGCYVWADQSCPNAGVGDTISSAVACDSMNSRNYIRCSDETPLIGSNPPSECVSVTCSVTNFCDPTSPSTC